MRIKCESCGSEEWTISLHEIKIQRFMSAILSVLKCDSCGMVYPLQNVSAGMGGRMSRDNIIAMLRK